MKRSIKAFFTTVLFAVTSVASAALITVNDGDTVTVQSGDQYQFVGGLSSSNSIYSVAFLFDLNETLEITISAPGDFDLISSIHTELNFNGETLGKPNILNSVFAGTDWTFTLDGNGNFGSQQVFSITTSEAGFDIIDSLPGGILDIAGTLGKSENVFVDPGPGGGGTNPTPVSSPGILMLMVLGLLFLGLRVTKGKCPSTQRKHA